MNISVGIVGLPNVGKSTLFNALLKKQVAGVANYPFCTIEPNKGIVEVPDMRLSKLQEVVNTQTIIPAVVEFYDIAGLVKGASSGEGLGNKFLSHIRETNIIAHVVRFFTDNEVIHVANTVNPSSDISVIETELILADLETLSKQREPKGASTEDDKLRWQTIQKLIQGLNDGIPARNIFLSKDEDNLTKDLHLITKKPVLFVCNVSEDQLQNISTTKKEVENILTEYTKGSQFEYIILCVKLESELVQLSEMDQKEYLDAFQIDEPGLNKLIKASYKKLGLISYLTAGEKEVRAWTIRQGENAQEAAGAIHTDFIKKFIKADIVSFDDFINHKGWEGSRDNGKVLSMGKEYIMKDGDIVEFKIGA